MTLPGVVWWRSNTPAWFLLPLVILGRIFMDLLLLLLLWDFLISYLVVYSTAAPARETLGAAAPVRVAPGVPTAPTQRPSLTVRRSAGDTVLASAAHSKDRSFTSLPLLPTGIFPLSALVSIPVVSVTCILTQPI